MRGRFTDQGGLFRTSCRISVCQRTIRCGRSGNLSGYFERFERQPWELYVSEGRPSIPPEQLLSALLLQVFYGIRSERQLMEQLDYNLLYCWFVGLSPDDPVWDPTTFTKNRERLQNGDVFTKFMTRLLNHPQVKPLLSDEHFSVDGTLIEAWHLRRAFVPRTVAVTTMMAPTSTARSARTTLMRVPATRTAGFIARRSDGRPSFAIWPRHHGEPACAGGGRQVTHANGTAERPSETMLKARRKAAGRRITAGEHKAYDTADHVANLRAIGVTPHVTQNQAVTKTGKPAPVPSMNELPAIRAMACRNRAERWSNASSDGASSMAPCARPSIVASLASPPTSCSI